MSEKEERKELAFSEKDLWAHWIRGSIFNCWLWDADRMAHFGYTYSILPWLKKIYKDPEDLKEAIRVHISPIMVSHPIGMVALQAADLAIEAKMGKEALPLVESLKAGLMGPIAALMDPIFWGMWFFFANVIGAQLAYTGIWYAPFVALGINMLQFPLISVPFHRAAFRSGADIVEEITGPRMKTLRMLASMVGAAACGGMIASFISVTTPWAYKTVDPTTGNTITLFALQPTLDYIFPGLFALAFFLLSYSLLKRGWSPVRVLLLLLVIGLVGGALGILA